MGLAGPACWPGQGPWGRARPGPVRMWTGTFSRNHIPWTKAWSIHGEMNKKDYHYMDFPWHLNLKKFIGFNGT